VTVASHTAELINHHVTGMHHGQHNMLVARTATYKAHMLSSAGGPFKLLWMLDSTTATAAKQSGFPHTHVATPLGIQSRTRPQIHHRP
jgi:hypothetical protein